MAKCNFSISYTQPIEQLIEKARKGIISQGGTFNGNTQSGSYSVPSPLGKITGTYEVQGNSIAFAITDKPFLVSCNRIKDELTKLINGSAYALSFEPDSEEAVTTDEEADEVGYFEMDTDGETDTIINKVIYTCSKCGEHSMPQNAGIAEATMEIAPDYTVLIENTETGKISDDLSSCIQFNKGGKVFSIRVEHNNGLQKYIIYVVAQGPAGLGSGDGYLRFEEFRGKTHDLKIWNSKKLTHTLKYGVRGTSESAKYGIKTISWSSTPFPE
jgi:hypothetical protein